jgi:hypothetical protein
VSVPENVPSSLVAGDLWQWTRSLADYPAGTWTLTYYFQNQSGAFSKAASASGTTHSVSIAAADTSAYKPGRYKYSARVASGLSVFTLEDEGGWLDVEPNPASAGGADVRSWARRTLDAIEAALEGKASQDQLSMSVGGRSIARIPPKDLMDWRDRLRSEVRAEEQSETSGKGRVIKARFDRP